MIKILAIGNSFSEDATAYLTEMAQADGISIKVVNLYIGGCSLKTHWENIIENNIAYDYQLNGVSTDIKISIEAALKEEEWDYITLQQASHDSGLLDTYYPYIENISQYVKEQCPSGKQLLHQTWAYEMDSNHSGFDFYGRNQEKMYHDLSHAYHAVAKKLELDLIPSGEVIQELRKLEFFDYKNGRLSLCRDGFHMSLSYGRFATAATWYQFILNKDILKVQYTPKSDNVNEWNEDINQLILKTIHKIYQKFMQYHKL